MKKFKTLFSVMICGAMLLATTSCGSTTNENTDSDTKGSAQTEKVTEEETEKETEPPKYQAISATIGDYVVTFDGAEGYAPYDDGRSHLLFYYTFTNNSDETVKPGSKVFLQSTFDGEKIGGIAFLEDAQPELYNSAYNDCAPGETIRCMECISTAEKDGTYEVTVMDMYHQIEDKLVVSIDTVDLPVSFEVAE